MADVTLTGEGGDVILDNLIQPPAAKGFGARGFNVSLQSAKSAAGGLIRLAGNVTGSKGIEQYGADLSTQADEAASADAMRVEDIHGFGDALDFAKYGIGYLVPQLLLSVAGGAVGKGIGALASRKVAADATRQLIQQTGMVGGAYAVSAGQEIGSIYNDAAKEGTPNAPERAITGGLAAGLLDVVPEFLAARKLGLVGDVAGSTKKGFGAVASQAAKVGAQGAALEGVTEAAQTGIERLSAGQPLTGAEANSDYLNSAVLGALGGGVIGAPVGAVEQHLAAGQQAAQDAAAQQAAAQQAATQQATADEAARQAAAANAPPEINPNPAEPLPILSLNGLPQDPIEAAHAQAVRDQAAQPIDPQIAHDFIVSQRDQLQTQVDGLQAQLKLSQDQRGATKQAITQQMKQIQAKIDDHNVQIGAIRNTISSPLTEAINRATSEQQANEAAAQAEATATKTAPAQPAPTSDIIALPGTAPAVDTKPAQIAVAQLKREQGQLISADEAKLLRSVATQPVTPKLELALSGRTVPREVARTLPLTERREVFRETLAQAATTRVDELVKAGVIREKARNSTVNALNALAARAVQHPTEQAMQHEITQGVAKALKGKANKDDVSVFTDNLLRDVAAASPTLFSKEQALEPGDVIQSIDVHDALFEQKGAEALAVLRQMIGTDPDLEVRLYQASPGSPVGSYTRTQAYKDVIELATNSQDVLSVAAHEGFHYLEHRVLNSMERGVIARSFTRGRPLFERVLSQAQAYDRANGTNLADEILSIPEEAHAYGFQFWRSGALQVQGTLARVFEKVRQLLERITNYFLGSGFVSTEDIFEAIDRGAYAADNRGEQFGAFDALTPELQLNSKAALIDMERQTRNGELEREQLMSNVADLLDKGQLRSSTFKELFGANKDSILGGLKRWRLQNIASGNYISKFSQGYANVQKVLLGYTQRKNTLIADGVDVKLSQWRTGASNDDIEAVGRVLMERTEKGYETSSPEYQTLVSGLSEKQKSMFDQATSMIADRLNKEFAADAITMRKVLNEAQFEEWQASRSTQVQKLIAQGYVPERRYGESVVHIYLPTADKTGKATRLTLHYEQFETETEAKLALKKYQEILAREAPELVAETGYRYKAERDTSLSFQQFLDTTRRYGIELSQSEKERLAKAMIGADSIRRNRIFRRKNIPGYSQDVMRVLSEFAVTMSNKIAYSEYSPAIEDALKGLEVEGLAGKQGTDLWAADGPESGFYRNQADELVDHVLTPAQTGEWSRKFRMLASLHFLGGSMAAGLVQLSSLPMNTVPWLYQHTSYTDAFTKVTSSLGLVTKNLNDLRDLSKLQNRELAIPAIDNITGLRDALVQAGEDGTTLDTEIYQIMGLTRGGMLAKSRKVQKAVETWMLPFRVTEQMNRMSTFIAAYRIGQEKNLTGRELYQFAQTAVHNTQFRYDEANRPSLARDPIWAILFTFKSYPIYMLEMIETLARQNKGAAAVMLTSLAVGAGVDGLPFAEDIMDLIDTIAQRVFGSPFNSKRAVRNIAKTASEALVGADLSSVVLNGVVNEVTGMSFASRVGLGNLIPGTRIGAADNDYARTANEILGPVASIVTGAAKGTGQLLKGDFLDALKSAGPLAVQNAVKGGEMAVKGYAEDQKGRKLVDVTGLTAFMQSVGFSPASLAKAYEMDRIDKQTLAFYRQVRDDFTTDFVKAVSEGKGEKAQEILTQINKWNQHYPEMPMQFEPGVLRRRIVEAGLPLNERTLRLLPRQLRGSSVALEGRGE